MKKGILCNDSKMQGPEKYNRIRYEFVTGDDTIPSDVTVSLGDVDPLTGEAITDVEIFQDYRRMRNRQVYCNLRVSRPEYTEKEKEERRLERLRIAEEFRADYGYEPTPEVVRYLQDCRWKSRYVLSLDSFVNEEENDSTLDYVSEMADKPVPATPEEFVRQRVIQYLLQEMHVPENKIVVEKALSSFGLAGNSKRIDIGILGEDNILNTIIECKAYGLQFSEAPFLQAIDYVEALKVKNYFVADGVYFDCYTYDAQNIQFVKLEKMPTYEEMC